jgi:hypothetical protein
LSWAPPRSQRSPVHTRIRPNTPRKALKSCDISWSCRVAVHPSRGGHRCSDPSPC